MGSGASSPHKSHDSQVITTNELKNHLRSDQDNSPTKVTTLASAMNDEAKDVMISYSHSDKEIMLKLKDALEANGISVWVDKTGLRAGVDFLGKIGQAIIDSKVFISLLSEKTIKSKFCQDELALAYVSNKPIYPVGLKREEELFPTMDTGMKLQLARFRWNLLTEEAKFEDDFNELLKRLQQELRPAEETIDENSSPETTKGKKVKYMRQASRHNMYTKNQSLSVAVETVEDEDDCKFWEDNFSSKESVPWSEFLTTFRSTFDSELKRLFVEEEKIVWLFSILEREMEVDESQHILKANYKEFCTVDGTVLPLWVCVRNQAIESYTMVEVFDMDSTVRVQAIENLAKFNSPAVRGALLDLLSEKDNNVKAVAAISLARTGAKDREVINKLMKCLNDKDRLVRESGCLALGHLEAEVAVPKLVQLWRNDFISHVREAASIALEKIGGEEANKAIHMTKVLSNEIHMLTKR